MEGRANPNAAYWLGTNSSDAGDPANWMDQYAPQTGDSIYFFGYNSNASCNLGGGSFDTVFLGIGYSGVVTVSGSLTATELDLGGGSMELTGGATLGTLMQTTGAMTADQLVTADNATQYGGTMNLLGGATLGSWSVTDGTASLGVASSAQSLSLGGGTIDQASGADLTVTTSLDWTGGTLNSTANAGMLHLVGATATIDPGGGTVSTGDTISLESGSTATFLPGTLNFLRGDGVDIQEFCVAQVKPTPNATVTFIGQLTTVNGAINVRSGGELLVKGPGTWFADRMTLTNAGLVEIKEKAIATCGKLGQAATTIQTLQVGGSIKLHSGATLGVASGMMQVTGGNVTIISDSPPGDTDPAKFVGNFYFAGGTLSTSGPRWTFQVTGWVTWSGGTYMPTVDASTNELADLWQIDGVLYFPVQTTAKIQPITVNAPTPIIIPVGWHWKVLRAEGGFQTIPPGSPRPDPLLVNTTGTVQYTLSLGQPGGAPREYWLSPSG